MMELPFALSGNKQKLLETRGHILTLGGPGSGKTTIALIKAKRIISNGIGKGQKVLFLSFARATIARVDQQSKRIIDHNTRKHLEINTYHGFAWNLLRSHGYLISPVKSLRLLTPPAAAAMLAETPAGNKVAEKRRLFTAEGLVHFDLFAGLCAELLSRSQSLAGIISSAYPCIILDEFQDTNADEWRFIQELGRRSTLLALADLDQRIYEFRGADPARIAEFIQLYAPAQFDFGAENNRSNGTDIAQFGNDLLTGSNIGKHYSNVSIKRYQNLKGDAIHATFKGEVLNACDRLQRSGLSNWSLALLVPSKKFVAAASDYLANTQHFKGNERYPSIAHDVAMDMEGPSLAANLIARMMEKGESDLDLGNSILAGLCEHIRGRNGEDGVSSSKLELTGKLREFLLTGKIRGSKRLQIVSEAYRIATLCKQLPFIGEPTADWLAVRKLLDESASEELKLVGADARYLRLLRKGTVMNSGLSDLWKGQYHYQGASGIVRSALVQDHFSASMSVMKGIHLMTIHKAKAKEFDEVIIYEGVHNGRIVWAQEGTKEYNQSRLALRVAVTRSMRRTTIVTPFASSKVKSCPFL